MKPRISVALVTRNRPDSLRRCLESLRAQSEQPEEVIISDDSDLVIEPEIRALAEEFSAVYQSGPKRGLYANRNAAAFACKGTHVRTMDDDHRFPPGHFELCREAVEENPEQVLTTGETTFVDGNVTHEVDTANQLHPAGVGGPVHDPAKNWAIADGSTTYPMEIFRRGYRMVEAFQLGSSYLEFGALLFRSGIQSRCIADAKVEHHVKPNELECRDPRSVLYASLCYNLRFQRNTRRAFVHLMRKLVRKPALIVHLPRLLQVMNGRWGRLS